MITEPSIINIKNTNDQTFLRCCIFIGDFSIILFSFHHFFILLYLNHIFAKLSNHSFISLFRICVYNHTKISNLQVYERGLPCRKELIEFSRYSECA